METLIKNQKIQEQPDDIVVKSFYL